MVRLFSHVTTLSFFRDFTIGFYHVITLVFFHKKTVNIYRSLLQTMRSRVVRNLHRLLQLFHNTFHFRITV